MCWKRGFFSREKQTVDIRTKRIYDEPSSADGARILVDRVWPRGVKKADARLDDWKKELAPSKDLRKWFSHDPEKWDEFVRRYRKELLDCDAEVNDLLAIARDYRLTLLYGARDTEHNNAVALKQHLDENAESAG